jgi:hypothetical protein
MDAVEAPAAEEAVNEEAPAAESESAEEAPASEDGEDKPKKKAAKKAKK